MHGAGGMMVLGIAALGALFPSKPSFEAAQPTGIPAAQSMRMQLVDLLRQGANVDDRDRLGRTALLDAVERGDSAAASRLIRAGADINAQAENRDTPWLLAGALGRTAILGMMLATGRVDYTKRNRYGGNALIPACHHGHVETVKLLLADSKVDIDHVNDLGWTALLEAIILGNGGARHTEIVRLLVAHGADTHIPDREGITPLGHARRRGYSEMVRILERAGAK